MTTIKALIFDMDGTLVDSEKIHWQAWKETLAVHGLKVPDYGEFKKYVGVSDEQMAQEFSAAAPGELDPAQLVHGKCRTYLKLVPEISLLEADSPLSTGLARPKSISLTSPDEVRMTFDGLMSR